MVGVCGPVSLEVQVPVISQRNIWGIQLFICGLLSPLHFYGLLASKAVRQAACSGRAGRATTKKHSFRKQARLGKGSWSAMLRRL